MNEEQAKSPLKIQPPTKKPRKPPTEKQLAALREHQFKPGQSGNPGGRHGTGKTVTAMLFAMLDKTLEELGIDSIPKIYQGKNTCEAVALRIIVGTINGDLGYLHELLNRTEGKVADRLAGHDGGALPGPSLTEAHVNAILADPEAAKAARSLADRLHMITLTNNTDESQPNPAGDGEPK